MKLLILLAIALTTSFSLAAEEEQEDVLLRKIASYQLIGDFDGAIQLAKKSVKEHPECRELHLALIKALAARGGEGEALQAYRNYTQQCISDIEENDSEIMEILAWASMRKGSHSGMMMTHLFSMVGATMTTDVQAVELLVDGMRSPNSLLRSVAVQLAPYLRDTALHEEIKRLFREENLWHVRMEVIRAMGQMHMVEMKGALREIVASDKSVPEEKWAAIISIVAMMEEASHEDLQVLASSPRGGLRELACEIIAQLDLIDELDLVAPLLHDPRADVRLAALNVFGLMRVEMHNGAPLTELIQPLLKDSQPAVAITAAWLYTLLDPVEGQQALEHWLNHENPDHRRLAAAALAATGKYGTALAIHVLETHSDPFVRANVAVGLIGQRVKTERAAEELYALCSSDNAKWMWVEGANHLFRVLSPSRLRYQDRIPNYPEVVNQMTRLEIMSLLAIVDHPRAQEALKQFLQERSWGITGVAAITLLEEGDEVALDLVRHLLDDPDPKVRVQAALGLALWGRDPSAASVLEEAYPEADRELKLKILDAIGRIGSRNSIPFLIETLQEPFPTLRILAASALVQCLNH